MSKKRSGQKKPRKKGKWNKTHGGYSAKDMDRLWRAAKQQDPGVIWDPT